MQFLNEVTKRGAGRSTRRLAMGLFGACALSALMTAATADERVAKPDAAALQAEPVLAPAQPDAGPGPVIPDKVPCPHPLTTTVVSSGVPQGPAAAAGPFPLNIPASSLASGLGDMHSNRTFEYSFKWEVPRERCCEILAARLTMVVKCHGDIPGNDAWGIYRNHLGLYGAPIGWPQSCNGQTKTIVWNVTPAVLNAMNADNQLNLLVEDDTAVMSAKLEISGCCVTRFKPM